MSKWAIPVGVGVGLAAYMFRDKLFPGQFTQKAGPQNVAVNTVQSGNLTQGVAPAKVVARFKPPAELFKPVVISPLPPAGTSPGGGSIGGGSGPSARDIGAGLGAAAAAAGCASIGGIGAIAAPLCAQGGAAVGAAAVKYGTQATNAIGSAAKKAASWVEDLF